MLLNCPLRQRALRATNTNVGCAAHAWHVPGVSGLRRKIRIPDENDRQ